MSHFKALILSALLLPGVACAADSSDAESKTATIAYKLAVVGGDAGDEAAFQDAIDCIMAGGIEGAETEERVADSLSVDQFQAALLA